MREPASAGFTARVSRGVAMADLAFVVTVVAVFALVVLVARGVAKL
ncbi:hypothetical protein [Streptomyces sp. WMMB 322]|nr:hypothetical protein [Streptomyces sp. WMMB 322]